MPNIITIAATRCLLPVSLLFSGANLFGQFTTIDCPGATSTQAVSLNNHGWVVGTCNFGNGTKSFYRTADGDVHILTVQKSPTMVADINDSNLMVGNYVNPDKTAHGFLHGSGVTTLFDYPGATNTTPIAMNASGAVTGLYTDSTGYHGFVRDALGNFSSFDPPSSGYTVPRSINTSGVVAGFFYNGSAATQGFVRDAEGNITVFSVPGSYSTTAFQINDAGFITGNWVPTNSFYAQGFTRAPSGNMTTFASPDAGPKGSTYPWSINASGVVAGYTMDGSSPYTYFGFTQSGSSTPVDFVEAPGVMYTEALKINNLGVVAGWYSTSVTGSHGFFGKP